MMKTIAGLLTIAAIFVGGVRHESNYTPVAKSYILMEASTGRVITGSNQDKVLPVASTTKIMTALITLEQADIYRYFTVDSNAIKIEGTSMGLRQGDSVNLYSLAAGMLLSSGNDAANGAAVKIAGSVSAFSKLMNERAVELGMTNTNFVTPSGLHDQDHYSTAYDMALLARKALANKTFAKICSSQKLTVEFGAPKAKRTLTNHNKLLQQYDGCVGVKTGFTKKAGRCLVSATTREGVTLICVTLGASDDWNVHKNLFDYGFSKVKASNIPINTDMLSINVVGGEQAIIQVKPQGETLAVIDQADLKNVKSQVMLDRFYYAPIKPDTVVGEIKHYLNGNEIATTTLISAQGTNIKPIKKK